MATVELHGSIGSKIDLSLHLAQGRGWFEAQEQLDQLLVDDLNPRRDTDTPDPIRAAGVSMAYRASGLIAVHEAVHTHDAERPASALKFAIARADAGDSSLDSFVRGTDSVVGPEVQVSSRLRYKLNVLQAGNL